MKIAILGGGGVGSAVALEIANAGHDADIFERHDALLKGASRVNEGKIHQGLIYAKDDPQKTARVMADGALDFRRYLSRWIDTDRALVKSTPFIYAVHRGSQLTGAQLRAHFETCCQIFNSLQAVGNRDYLGSRQPMRVDCLSAARVEDVLDPSHFETAFQSTELAVDPNPIADALAQAVDASGRVTLRLGAVVSAVSMRGDGRYMVHHGARCVDGPYDQVVNATWESRLAIDRSMGLKPPRSWSLRHKFGHRVALPLKDRDLPSVTAVLGAYGDIVNFGGRGFFLSWYPTGMVQMTRNAGLPDTWDRIDHADRIGNFRKSFEHWRARCPLLAGLDIPERVITPTSGIIYALGESDIVDPDSMLHTRNAIGVQSIAGYHTVDTGKFTLMPKMAMIVASRVLGRDSPV